jgi:hypothetical protein
MINLDFRSLGWLAAGLAPLIAVAFLGRPIISAVGGGVWLALLVAAAIAFFVCFHFYCRRLDEAAWEGQKFAWLWGGSLGGVAGIVLAVTPSPARDWISGGVADLAARWVESAHHSLPEAAFHVGAGYILVAQIIGFMVVWIGWWIAKR